MLVGMRLARAPGVFGGVCLVGGGGMGVVSGFLVVTGFVMLGRLLVVVGGFLVAVSSLLVVGGGFGGHGWEKK